MIEVAVTPDAAAWSLIYGAGFVHEGSGDRIVSDLPAGDVTLTWAELAGYDTPEPTSETRALVAGTTVTFTAAYNRQTGRVNIEVTPLDGAWLLTGPEGLHIEDSGTTTLLGLPTGRYTISWMPLGGWGLPKPSVQSETLDEENILILKGQYGPVSRASWLLY